MSPQEGLLQILHPPNARLFPQRVQQQWEGERTWVGRQGATGRAGRPWRGKGPPSQTQNFEDPGWICHFSLDSLLNN